MDSQNNQMNQSNQPNQSSQNSSSNGQNSSAYGDYVNNFYSQNSQQSNQSQGTHQSHGTQSIHHTEHQNNESAPQSRGTYSLRKIPAPIGFPIVLIAIGIAWLLWINGLLPTGAQFLGAALIVVGLLIFVLSGINKKSVVLSPMLIYVGICTLIYNSLQEKIGVEYYCAVGLIVYGLLLLLSYADFIPEVESRSKSSS